ASLGSRDRLRERGRVVAFDDGQLETAGAGVDDQHPQLEAQFPTLYECVHVQVRISGGSSPSARVYARLRSRSSTMRCRSSAACEPRPGTRSITSMTRWKRSRSLSMTMSNGVVVVPSSLYPRTCRLPWFVRRYARRWISQG